MTDNCVISFEPLNMIKLDNQVMPGLKVIQLTT